MLVTTARAAGLPTIAYLVDEATDELCDLTALVFNRQAVQAIVQRAGNVEQPG